jgi:hypothetical protein
MKSIQELENEIELTINYLALLTHELALAETIEKGRQASAEILTEKLIERIKHD